MVRRMVIVLALLAVALPTLAKRIKIYPAEPMLGQAVTLSMPADILFIEKRFNWAALKRCFAVYSADYGSERVRFTLYPRRVGACDIPRERWESWEVPSHFVVRPNPDVKVRWTLPSGPVWLRQGVRWQAQVQLASESGYRAWLEAAQTDRRKWVFSPLAGGWLQALWWPTQAGVQRLGPLFVAVKNPGGQVWRFPGEAVSLQVRPLPVWLPVDVIVGHITRFAFDAPTVVARGEAAMATLTLTGVNLYPELPPQPDALLPTVAGVRWGYGHKEVERRWTADGQQLTVRLRQPLIVERYGRVRLPQMSVQSFDPLSGRVTRSVVPAQTLWSLPGWLIWLGRGVAMLAALVLGGMLLVVLWRLGWDGWLAWQTRRLRGHALWRAMLRWYQWRNDPLRRRPPPKTPRQWLRLHPRPQQWESVVIQLEKTLFDKNPP